MLNLSSNFVKKSKEEIVENFLLGKNLSLVPNGEFLYNQYRSEISSSGGCRSCATTKIQRKYRSIIRDALK
jgi:hypothetical protein